MAYTANDKGMYEIPLVAFGKRLRDNFGLDIGEHSAFGGNSGGHAPNSYHNYDEAIDIRDWRDDDIDGVSWQKRTANLRNMLKGAGPEVLGPGDKGHDTHVHLAATNGMLNLNQSQYDYFFGGKSGGSKALFDGATGLEGGSTSTPKPDGGTATPSTKEFNTPEAINAEYDRMRMAGDIGDAEKFGMKQWEKMYGGK